MKQCYHVACWTFLPPCGLGPVEVVCMCISLLSLGGK